MQTMTGGGDSVMASAGGAMFCLVPSGLAPKLEQRLRRHFAARWPIEVIVETRARERRGPERRVKAWAEVAVERRRIRGRGGRRVGERRAPLAVVDGPGLPRAARGHEHALQFVERLPPSALELEDLDTARLIVRFQAGDPDAFSVLYLRYFDRVYRYLKFLLKDAHEAEDAAQHVFVQVLKALGSYEHRPGQPFRAWLFVVVRHIALREIQKLRRVDLLEPAEMDRRRDLPEEQTTNVDALRWLSDNDLALFVERLPVSQRQVLMLRYLVDLTPAQIALVLDRSVQDVHVLQHRALSFLRARLTALGRAPQHGSRSRMHRRISKAPVLRARRFALGG
jgi:RNA polymerase sigma-70 factor (ECF subfamily)